MRGRSSSGRARPCQGRGSEFEPRRPLQNKRDTLWVSLLFWNLRKSRLEKAGHAAGVSQTVRWTVWQVECVSATVVAERASSPALFCGRSRAPPLRKKKRATGIFLFVHASLHLPPPFCRLRRHFPRRGNHHRQRCGGKLLARSKTKHHPSGGVFVSFTFSLTAASSFRCRWPAACRSRHHKAPPADGSGCGRP